MRPLPYRAEAHDCDDAAIKTRRVRFKRSFGTTGVDGPVRCCEARLATKRRARAYAEEASDVGNPTGSRTGERLPGFDEADDRRFVLLGGASATRPNAALI